MWSICGHVVFVVVGSHCRCVVTIVVRSFHDCVDSVLLCGLSMAVWSCCNVLSHCGDWLCGFTVYVVSHGCVDSLWLQVWSLRGCVATLWLCGLTEDMWPLCGCVDSLWLQVWSLHGCVATLWLCGVTAVTSVVSPWICGHSVVVWCHCGCKCGPSMVVTSPRLRGLTVVVVVVPQQTEEQMRLLRFQRQLEDELKDEYLDLSVHQTIYRLVLQNKHRHAENMRREFKVPERRYGQIPPPPRLPPPPHLSSLELVSVFVCRSLVSVVSLLVYLLLSVPRVATGQGKVREIQGQGKVREFCAGSGKFEILRKVREIQENPLKVREI